MTIEAITSYLMVEILATSTTTDYTTTSSTWSSYTNYNICKLLLITTARLHVSRVNHYYMCTPVCVLVDVQCTLTLHIQLLLGCYFTTSQKIFEKDHFLFCFYKTPIRPDSNFFTCNYRWRSPLSDPLPRFLNFAANTPKNDLKKGLFRGFSAIPL